MPHELAFADAARQAPVSILRLPMLPYSIGHEIILLQQRNALVFTESHFVTLEPDKQIASIMRAALVCYRTWEQNKKPDKVAFWGWMIRKSNWPLEIATFRNYRNEGASSPPSPTKEADEIANGKQDEAGRALGGCHMALLLDYATNVYESLGYESAFDVPLGLLSHLYLSTMEVEGNTRIENAKEAQVREEMDKHRTNIANEQKAKAQAQDGGTCQV